MAGGRERLGAAIATLTAAGIESARLDAELLIAHAAGLTRAELLTSDLNFSDGIAGNFDFMVARRARREPLAYIVGQKEFYGLEIEVSRAVLIPRPETETLVTAALDWIAHHSASRVFDLGTGSGAIAIAIATHASQVRLEAGDISEDALEVARRNAIRNGLATRIEFRRADCFEPLDERPPLGCFDLIVSNPPYIVDRAISSLQPDIAEYEPRVALAGGADGLDFYRRIAQALARHLVVGGCAMLEIGDHQIESASAIFRANGFSVTAIPDLSGTPRVIVANARSG